MSEKDGFEGRDKDLRRLLYEIRAKGGLPPNRINRLLNQ
jgi:hypothetical protein